MAALVGSSGQGSASVHSEPHALPGIRLESHMFVELLQNSRKFLPCFLTHRYTLHLCPHLSLGSDRSASTTPLRLVTLLLVTSPGASSSPFSGARACGSPAVVAIVAAIVAAEAVAVDCDAPIVTLHSQ